MGKATSILVIALIAVSLVGLVLFLSNGGSGSGRGYGAQTNQNSTDGSIWLAAFLVPLIAALAVAVYALLFPKIKVEEKMAVPQTTTTALTEHLPLKQVEPSQSLEAVLRVLNSDEQKIIKAIAAAKDGAILQKDLKAETGLSRVKTHRVLARLAARGIVKAEKYYNTNRIVLADWVTKKENE